MSNIFSYFICSFFFYKRWKNWILLRHTGKHATWLWSTSAKIFPCFWILPNLRESRSSLCFDSFVVHILSFVIQCSHMIQFNVVPVSQEWLELSEFTQYLFFSISESFIETPHSRVLRIPMRQPATWSRAFASLFHFLIHGSRLLSTKLHIPDYIPLTVF